MRSCYPARFALSLCCFSLLFAGGNAFLPSTAEASTMGGVCAECHEEVATAFAESYHARIWQGTGRQSDCQSCHGSADKHADDPSPQSIISFGRQGKRSADDLSRQCLECHDSSTHLAMWDMGEHSRNDISCASCHTIHTSRSAVNQPTVCFTCHRSTRVQVNKQSHHPIIEGKVKCSDCHNTHGTLSHNMIKAENINQLCYQCHPDKRGPFVYEHPPVEENCAICHAPHGSRHSKLLTEKIPNLCQDCHDWSRHPGTPYDADRAFTGSNPSNRFFSRSCLNCHGNIHGSSNFQNNILTR